MRDTAALRALERLEMYLYRKASRIVAVTHAFKTSLASRGVDSRKIDVVTNGANLATFVPCDRDQDLARRLGLTGRFVAGYIGTHGMAHGLETLLDAAVLLQYKGDAERICLLFLGNGARKADLVGMAAARGIRNVLFLDSVPKDEVAAYWALLDVSVIHLRKTELFKSVIPSKLFECMAMGVPVLHGVPGESADIVIKERVGEVFESGNARQLAEALVRLSNDPQACQAYGRAGVVAATHYDRKVLAGRMLAILKGLVST
jgi:glycosyltransferase involved in cell wall biosynthesis